MPTHKFPQLAIVFFVSSMFLTPFRFECEGYRNRSNDRKQKPMPYEPVTIQIQTEEVKELDPKASVCLHCRFLLDRSKSNFRFKHVHHRPHLDLKKKNECLGPMRRREMLNSCMSRLCSKYSVLSTNWTQHAQQMILEYVEKQTPGCRVSLDIPTMDETNISVCYCGDKNEEEDDDYDEDDVDDNDSDDDHDLNDDDDDQDLDHDDNTKSKTIHADNDNDSNGNDIKEVENEMKENSDLGNVQENITPQKLDSISKLYSKYHHSFLNPSKLGKIEKSQSQIRNQKSQHQSQTKSARENQICKMKESTWEVNINYGEKILGFEMTLSLPFFDSSVTNSKSSVTFKSPSCILNRK